MAEAHALDVVTNDLIGLFERGRQRLELLTAAGLRRGLDPSRLGTADQAVGDATQAYRDRQLIQARAILAELRAGAQAHGPLVVARSYGAGLVATDRTVGAGANLAGRFGRVHVGVMEVLASNLTASLEAAVQRAGDNLELVFQRASELEGALSPNLPGGLPRSFIGRRVDDPYRRIALEQIAQGNVALETRRQVSADLARRLVDEGVADALTGFVDRAGRRWPLEHYAAMVARTTTREAASRATVNRLTENGLDVVTISSHPHREDVCTPYDGKTFSLRGATPGLPVLDVMPPFHPFCVHVLTPGEGNLDAFEAELRRAVTPEAPPRAAAPLEPPPAPTLEAPAAAPAPLAAGERPVLGSVADAFQANDTIRTEPYLRDVAAAIDHVHRVPADVPRIPITVGQRGLPRGAEGAYSRLRSGDAIEIIVKPGAEPTVGIHEIGHFLDHKALIGRRISPATVDTAVSRADELAPIRRLLERLEETGPIRKLRRALETGKLELGDGQVGELGPAGSKARKLVEYLVSPVEQYARGYESWVIRRAGATSARQARGAGFEYWDDPVDHAIIDAAYDDLFRDLGLLREDTAPAPRLTATSAEADPPFGGEHPPRIGDETARRLEEQRAIDRLVAGDPGRDPADVEAWEKWVDSTVRRQNRALNKRLGPDLAQFIDRAWGKKAGVRRRLLEGELTVEDAEELAYEEWQAIEGRRALREIDSDRHYGLESRSTPCFSCGRLKRRPADVCPYCGDDPVPTTTGTSATQNERARFNADYGYAHVHDEKPIERTAL